MPEKQCDSMMDTDRAEKSHAMDLGKPKGVHFMPETKCESVGVQKRILGKNNDEWYLLETIHSLKVLVPVSKEDDDEQYKLEAMHSSKTEA